MSTVVSASASACANSTNPICYSTAISGANLLTNLWISCVFGGLCFFGFVFFRTRFRFYQARLDMPHVTHKPPPLKVNGFHRLWSWLTPVFNIPDEELLMSAGMDALIAVRILSFGILLLLPVTIAAMTILVPINYLDNYYQKEGKTAGLDDVFTTVFIRLTMSNLTPGSPLMWVHFLFVYGVVFWACWLITEQYKEYISLRQNYVIRSTAVPHRSIGGSMETLSTSDTVPLLRRKTSPMKNKQVLARTSTAGREIENNRNGGGSGSGGGTSGGNKRTKSSVRLPRRDASGSSAGEGSSEHYEGGALGGGSGNFGSGRGGGGSRVSRLSGLGQFPTSGHINTNNTLLHHHHSTIELTTTTTSAAAAQSQQQQQHGILLASPNNKDVHASATAAAGKNPANSHQGGGGGPPNGGINTTTTTSRINAPVDWTTHDFSQEILPQYPSSPLLPSSPSPSSPTTTTTTTTSMGAWSPLLAEGEVSSSAYIHTQSHNNPSTSSSSLRVQSPTALRLNSSSSGLQQHQILSNTFSLPSRSSSFTGTGGGTAPVLVGPPLLRLSGINSHVNPISRMPSNAAVAAALDFSANPASTAAEALAKIRHHRALSGASAGGSGMTPAGGNTPRVLDSTGSGGTAQNPSSISRGGSGLDLLQLQQHQQHQQQQQNGRSIATSPFSGISAAAAAAAAAPSGTIGNPPHDLAGIIEAVSSLSDQQNSMDGSGGLTTSTALAPELASPNGQEGVAQRWWASISSLGNRIVERRRSKTHFHSSILSPQSITYKGAVASVQLPDGAFVAANASLYTVLVTDQPVERLRLKRPLGNLEFWHQRNYGAEDLLGLQTSTVDEMEAREFGEGMMTGGGDGDSGGGLLNGRRRTHGHVADEHEQHSNSNTKMMPSQSGAPHVFVQQMQQNGFPAGGDVEHGLPSSPSTNGGNNNTTTTAAVELGNSSSSNQHHLETSTTFFSKFPFFWRHSSQPPQQQEQEMDTTTTNNNTNTTTNSSSSSTQHRRNNSYENDPSVGEATGIIILTSGVGAAWSGIRAWWLHRGRYKEWRRDVRWAMFNKRVRTATEMFTELFGDDFDGIVPIYPTASVDKLIHEWDNAAAALERAQYSLKDICEKHAVTRRSTTTTTTATTTTTSTTTNNNNGLLPRTHANGGATTTTTNNSTSSSSSSPGLLQRLHLRSSSGAPERTIIRLKHKIAALAAKTATLQEQISAERDAVLSDLPSTCFFATFKSQEAAAVAAQANLNPITQRLFDVQEAPSPDDMNWPALERTWWQRQARPVCVLPLIMFIMLLPIGAFTGAFAQLTIAFCGNPGNPGPAGDQWFCSDDRWAVFIRNILTSIAPSILLSIYHMCILPVLVYYAAQAEGRCISLSQLDRRSADLFFYWDVFNVFLGAMLGGSVLSELPQYLENPQAIWETLSSAIPASSNFFINYCAYRALVMAWFRLFYPHQAIVTCIFKWLHIVPWAKTPRDKAMEAPVRNCRYGRDIGIPVLMNFVMVLAYAVVSPLILPFGLLYFVLLWAVWRYQMLYVYQRQYESGGQFWPFVAHKVVGCLLLLVLFTAAVLIFKQAYPQAALMLVTLPLYLLRFDNYLTTRYDAVVAQVPLMAVHKAGRVSSVDPSLWTPPPLRQGAVGWHPEWGKMWQFWGIPRYTL